MPSSKPLLSVRGVNFTALEDLPPFPKLRYLVPLDLEGGLPDEGYFIPVETEQTGGAPEESLIVLAAPEQKLVKNIRRR
ncbi:hypothetical protein DVH24_028992 [Malus domestica]|uniref:Uncharacterized protein n=1 Tax=Malus domestica TaxID=3750 RepID=A0A498HYM3_MALDO|nr:hypothetical protein DVH24_028992 [Malus domestica]